MSTRGVVGQVDAQHQRQHQNREETEQKWPGSGHSHPVTARDTVALVQELVSTSRSGHVSGKVSVAAQSVERATCTSIGGGMSKQEVEEGCSEPQTRSKSWIKVGRPWSTSGLVTSLSYPFLSLYQPRSSQRCISKTCLIYALWITKNRCARTNGFVILVLHNDIKLSLTYQRKLAL